MAKRMREFVVTLTTVVRLSPRVIRQGMGKEFAESIFPATSPERVAEHVAFNMVVNQIELSSIDGFANLPDKDAECARATVDEAYEVTGLVAPLPKRKPRKR